MTLADVVAQMENKKSGVKLRYFNPLSYEVNKPLDLRSPRSLCFLPKAPPAPADLKLNKDDAAAFIGVIQNAASADNPKIMRTGWFSITWCLQHVEASNTLQPVKPVLILNSAILLKPGLASILSST